MSRSVVETHVSWTWAQLEAAQERWARRLGDLFKRAQVATWLSPDRNAVEIELGSRVPESRRTALKRQASKGTVRTLVIATPYRQLSITHDARCSKFASKAAYCDPTIVGGVTINGPVVSNEEEAEGETEEGQEEEEFEAVEGGVKKFCTAGPTALLKEPTNVTDALRTYVLTAGHCLSALRRGGGVGAAWVAYDTQGAPKGEHQIGKAVADLWGETDVGAIEVSTAYWAGFNDPIPVFAAIAPWNQAAPDPVPVIAQRTPMLNAKSCMAGQTTGLSCGKIIKLNQQITWDGVTTKNLIEVQGATATKRDSGAPWFSQTEFEEAEPQAFVEGTDVGRKGATGNPVFQSLERSFQELNSLKGLNLKLLTRSNERRLPAFFGGDYPVTLSAQNASAEDVFNTATLKGKCSEDAFHGEIAEAEADGGVSEIELKPTYGKCVAEGGLKFDVELGSEAKPCHYLLTAGSEITGESEHVTGHIECSEGEKMKVKVTFGGLKLSCLEIPPQEVASVHYANGESKGVGDLEVTLSAEGITYTEIGACGSETRKDGVLKGHFTLTGANEAKEAVGVWRAEP